MPRPRLAAAALALPLLLGAAACAGPRDAAQPAAGGGGGTRVAAAATATDPSDPFEPTNRRVLDFNLGLDDCCLKPIAVGYRHAVHPWVRTRLRNVVDNLLEPRFAVNALLQGQPRVAGESTMRFVINSTLGLGGMFDLAPVGGPPRQPRDFGQTLARWGVGSGPYLMVPVTGPSNPRDLVGSVADGFMNPISWALPLWGNLARTGVEGVDLREQNIETLDALRGESLDFYARLRSVAQQRRAGELGVVPRLEARPPEVLDDPGGAAPAAGPAAGAAVRPTARRLGAAPAATPHHPAAARTASPGRRDAARPGRPAVTITGRPTAGRPIGLRMAAR